MFLNEVERDFAEPGIVLRTGQRESSRIGLEAILLAKIEALLFRFFVATPWREPDAHRRPISLRGSSHRSKSPGEACVHLPSRMRIVPSVIKEERIQFHVALAYQLGSKGVD